MIQKAFIAGILAAVAVFSQEQGKKTVYEFMWINGGLGGGGVVSTNIINSGAVLPFYAEFCLQKSRTRLGFGICDEVYLTPENLGKLLLGNSSNVQKMYLTWEWMLIPNFPINLGPCAQVGGFLVGNDIKKANSGKDIPTSNFFGNVGLVGEVGWRPVFLFVKPYFEFKSYGVGHKELIVAVTLGGKIKLLTEEEKARRAAKKKKN
jgi:hypothetical protein